MDNVRVGVAGTGKIVPEALGAMAPVAGLEVAAVCSRPHSRERGEELAAAHGIPTVYVDYDEMLANPGLDAIYVAVVNSAHADYARRALVAGKHVICEKPFTVTAGELRALTAVAGERGLVLFEAISLLHLPAWHRVKELSETLGGVRLFDAAFCKYSSRYDAYRRGEISPSFDPAHAGGALMDLNVYNLHAAVDLLGKPKTLVHRANLGPNGLDTSGVVVLDYGAGVAVCSAAKDADGRLGAAVSGPDGTLEIEGPLNTCGPVTVRRGDHTETLPAQPGHRMTPEFEVFTDLVRRADLPAATALLARSQTVMELLSTARNQTSLTTDD